LNSLPAASSQESYGHAIDEFIGWYCSEPPTSINRAVVLRYRFFLEQNNLAHPQSVSALPPFAGWPTKLQIPVSRVPSWPAGIRRVKGAKRLGVRIGNWLTIDQSKRLLRASCSETNRDKRDRAILALLIGCGLPRAERVALKVEDLQIREEHRVIADPIEQRETYPHGSGSRMDSSRP